MLVTRIFTAIITQVIISQDSFTPVFKIPDSSINDVNDPSGIKPLCHLIPSIMHFHQTCTTNSNCESSVVAAEMTCIQYHTLHKDTASYQMPTRALRYKVMNLRTDGNCFFAILSYLRGNGEHSYSEMRKNVTEYLEKEWQNIIEELQVKDGRYDKQVYIKSMKNESSLATDIELYAAAQIYGMAFILYLHDKSSMGTIKLHSIYLPNKDSDTINGVSLLYNPPPSEKDGNEIFGYYSLLQRYPKK